MRQRKAKFNMKNKTTVIYHSADFDGIFCREIARKFMPDATFIGWNFGDPVVPVEPATPYYVMDLPVYEVFGVVVGLPHESLELAMKEGRVIWIDHHKSSIESHKATPFPGYQMDGVAACRLAYQWFIYHGNPSNGPGSCLPYKEHFIERILQEPRAVRLAGEYDIWDKRDPKADLFQHGLRSRELKEEDWKWLLTVADPHTQGEYALAKTNFVVDELLGNARYVEYASRKQNESIIRQAGFTLEWQGLKFLACNHARYNSYLFTAALKPEHDACLGFAWRGDQWTVSLYHAPGKEQHDLSLIAVKYGGGGRRGACGFQTRTLPFLPAPLS